VLKFLEEQKAPLRSESDFRGIATVYTSLIDKPDQEVEGVIRSLDKI
jgi:hypothetical protein